MMSTARFVNGSAFSGAGKLMWVDAAIEMPIFDGRGYMTGMLRARDVLRDLRTLVAEIEGAIYPRADEDEEGVDLETGAALDSADPRTGAAFEPEYARSTDASEAAAAPSIIIV